MLSTNERNSAPVGMKILCVLTSGFGKQVFLGQFFIPFLLKITPKKYKKGFALWLIAISHHYFVYQWSGRYPANMPRAQILEAEHQRNISTRKKICQQILQPYLLPHMTVLDFGCGPGYLAREAALHVKKVMAADISCGVIACAKALNNADNISYQVNKGADLSALESSSLDLVYTFAVLQHLSEDAFETILKEFFRVLKPQGKVIAHVAIGDNYCAPEKAKKGLAVFKHFKQRFALLMIKRSSEDVSQKISKAGFEKPVIIPIQEISDVEDDIGKQHLFIFDKL